MLAIWILLGAFLESSFLLLRQACKLSQGQQLINNPDYLRTFLSFFPMEPRDSQVETCLSKTS